MQAIKATILLATKQNNKDERKQQRTLKVKFSQEGEDVHINDNALVMPIFEIMRVGI